MVIAVARKPVKKINFAHMLKRRCSIKKFEVFLLCEILISKDTLKQYYNCPSLVTQVQMTVDLHTIAVAITIPTESTLTGAVE